MSAEKRMLIRGALEIGGDVFMPVDKFAADPKRDEMMPEVVAALKKDIKDAVWGLAPIFGEEQVLALCLAVIREDFDADGPQTPLPSSFFDEEDAGGAS